MRKKQNQHLDITTWEERFSQAISVMCQGRIPPHDLIQKWIDNVEDNQLTLQDWIFGEGKTSFHWAQAIVIIDAAQILADSPEEGCDHLGRK